MTDPWKLPAGGDPWSDKAWGQQTPLKTSFERDEDEPGILDTSGDVFEFSPVPSADNDDLVFDNFTFPSELPPDKSFDEQIPTVQVAVTEQLSVVYDDSGEPVSQIQGTIVVRPKKEMRKPFCLTVKDVGNHINEIEPVHRGCEILTRQRNETVLRMNHVSGEATIASYSCFSSLRPVPILVKTRVQNGERSNRVGFKIRSNPSNQYNLTRIVMMMAVPPHVDGESVKMSRQGGIWDEIKRTLSWFVEKLAPGAAIEIQAQFSNVEGKESTATFPILVRTEYPVLYSAVQITTDFQDSSCTPIRMDLNESGRLLHRKI